MRAQPKEVILIGVQVSYVELTIGKQYTTYLLEVLLGLGEVGTYPASHNSRQANLDTYRLQCKKRVKNFDLLIASKHALKVNIFKHDAIFCK